MGLTKERARHTFIGTVSFMAPEVIEQDTGYDFKADIWSFGITVLELITGTAPFHKFPPLKVLMMTLQNDPPSLESVSEYEDQYKNYGKSIRKLIVECLQKDPTKRPTASELLKHPFIRKAKDRRYLMQTLLPSTPSFAERSRRALDNKRGSLFTEGSNGESGSWVWPPEENGEVGPNNLQLSSIINNMANNNNKNVDKTNSNDVIPVEPARSIATDDGVSQSSESVNSVTDGVGSVEVGTDSINCANRIETQHAIHSEEEHQQLHNNLDQQQNSNQQKIACDESTKIRQQLIISTSNNSSSISPTTSNNSSRRASISSNSNKQQEQQLVDDCNHSKGQEIEKQQHK